VAFNSPTQHQNYQVFPKLDTPLIDSQGNVGLPWYRLLMTLWTKCGGSFSQLPFVQYVEAEVDSGNQPTGQFAIMSPQNGASGGTIVTEGSSGADSIVLEALSLMPPAPPTPVSAEAGDPLEAVLTAVPPDQPHPSFVPAVPADQLDLASAINLSVELSSWLSPL
jgi:hypothetical protein